MNEQVDFAQLRLGSFSVGGERLLNSPISPRLTRFPLPLVFPLSFFSSFTIPFEVFSSPGLLHFLFDRNETSIAGHTPPWRCSPDTKSSISFLRFAPLNFSAGVNNVIRYPPLRVPSSFPAPSTKLASQSESVLFPQE